MTHAEVRYGAEMGSPLPGRTWRFRRLLALVVAVGLLGRIAAPVLAMPMLTAALLADAGICHAASQPDGDAPIPAGDCFACPTCHAVGQPGLLPVSLAVPVAIFWRPAVFASWADATGPPLIAAAPFRSRAPPALS